MIMYTFGNVKKQSYSTYPDVDSKYITTSYGIYQHVSQLIKDDLTDSEYGLYSINVSNNIGPYFQHDFNVVEESKYVLIKYVSRPWV
jgi:hypothetical protein